MTNLAIRTYIIIVSYSQFIETSLPLLANIARERLLARVRPLVNFQMILNPEALGTNITWVGLQILMDILMLSESLLGGERISTRFAHRTRLRRGMNVPVPPQRRRTVEACRTDLTAVSFLVRVNPHVGLQVGFGAKVFGADFTKERSNSLVLELMPHQRFARWKLLVALVAGKIEVNRNVISEPAFPSESRRTLATMERFLACVDYDVHLQRCGVSEGFRTAITEKGSFAGVCSKVSFEHKFPREGFVTRWAFMLFRSFLVIGR